MLKTGDFIRITASHDPLFGESLVGSICEILSVSANGQEIDVLANGRVSATLSVSDGTTWEMADVCDVTVVLRSQRSQPFDDAGAHFCQGDLTVGLARLQRVNAVNLPCPATAHTADRLTAILRSSHALTIGGEDGWAAIPSSLRTPGPVV